MAKAKIRQPATTGAGRVFEPRSRRCIITNYPRFAWEQYGDYFRVLDVTTRQKCTFESFRASRFVVLVADRAISRNHKVRRRNAVKVRRDLVSVELRRSQWNRSSGYLRTILKLRIKPIRPAAVQFLFRDNFSFILPIREIESRCTVYYYTRLTG